jgi:hypothetical protein
VICRVRSIILDDSAKENVRVLYNAMSNSLPLMSILVSAKYPPFDLSGERVAPRRVASESRASCPTLYEKKRMNKTKNERVQERDWPVAC